MYLYHFPELKIVRDNYMYAKVAKYVKSHKDLTEDMLEGLKEILMNACQQKMKFYGFIKSPNHNGNL